MNLLNCSISLVEIYAQGKYNKTSRNHKKIYTIIIYLKKKNEVYSALEGSAECADDELLFTGVLTVSLAAEAHAGEEVLVRVRNAFIHLVFIEAVVGKELFRSRSRAAPPSATISPLEPYKSR